MNWLASSLVQVLPPSSERIERAVRRFDHGVDDLRLGRRNRQRDSAVGLRGKALAVGVGEFRPVLAAVGGLEEAAARTAGAEGPTLAAEIPHRGIDRVRFQRAHGQHAAAGRSIAARQHFAPRLAAVAGLVDAALVVVVPQMAGGTRVNRVAVLRIDQDPGDVLGILQADIGPVLAAVGRFVDAVADRDAVAHPGLAGAHPHDLRIGGIDGDGADRLHVRLVEHRLEGGAAVDRLPHAAAGRGREDREPSLVVDRIHRGDASAHPGRADIAGRQAGDGGGIELDGRLRRPP